MLKSFLHMFYFIVCSSILYYRKLNQIKEVEIKICINFESKHECVNTKKFVL